MSLPVVITIDGPSGSGKGTVAALLAAACNGICLIQVRFIVY